MKRSSLNHWITGLILSAVSLTSVGADFVVTVHSAAFYLLSIPLPSPQTSERYRTAESGTE